MNELLYIFVSLSVAGSILALILFSLKPLLRDRLSKTWQYYIWIVVISRLLIPYAPQSVIIGELFSQRANYMIGETQILNVSNNLTEETQPTFTPLDADRDNYKHSTQNYWNYLNKHIGSVWFCIAMMIFVQKITSYNNYIAFIKTGNRTVNQNAMNLYRIICADLGIKKPLELYVNNLIISPMLIGIVHPFIALPASEIGEQELYNIVLHEFTHYKRLDIFYKWITQIVICLHWFNPLIYLISKEISKNCELSCDESIIKILDCDGKRQYGNTLLASVRVSKPYLHNIVSLTLNNDAKLLKERLGAIMKFKKKSKFTFALTIILTLAMCFSSTFIGAYASPPSNDTTNTENGILLKSGVMKTSAIGNIKFYLVENEEDLRAIGSGIYSLSDNYMLNCDISLTKEWIAIGNDATPFTGMFEGNGFTINNLIIKDKTVKYAGLFGFAEGATIHNVTLTNVDIKDAGGNGRHVGPLVAIGLHSEISDCIVK